MKAARTLAIALTCLIPAFQGYAQEHGLPCAFTRPVDAPAQPSLDRCYNGIDKYLARAIFATGLAGFQLDEPGGLGTRKDYCDFINACVRLKAAYLSRVTYLWDGEARMIPGKPWYQATKKAVSDIHSAYAAAGLRLPIIEAAILENVTDEVNIVPIPGYVLQAFSDEEGFEGHYTTSGQFKFKQANICTDPLVPDVTRIEARMWMYYLATQYLDMGYRGLHMGNYSIISSRDRSGDHPYGYTASIFNRIRKYAASLPNGFVILNADLGDIYLNNDHNTLLFDFVSSPIRPWETLNNDAYAGMPCANNKNAELFGPALDNPLLKSEGGMSPTGCPYEHTPVLFNLDWAGCDKETGVSYFFSHYPNYHPWGYDEASWFDQLSDSCQAFWLHQSATAMKNNIGHRLYLKMPGLNGMICSRSPSPENRLYKMTHKPIVLNTVAEKTWQPNRWLDFTITTFGEKNNNRKRNLQYTLQVTEPDATSVYTWHVQQVDGQWLPYTFGTTRTLTGLDRGNYTVFLVATNLGFANDDHFGDLKEQIRVSKTFYVGDKENQLNDRSGPEPVSDSSCCYGR